VSAEARGSRIPRLLGTSLPVVMCAALIASAACSSSKSIARSQPNTLGSVKRPSGPAAALSQEITGGNGPFMGSAAPTNLKASGYVEHEYVAAGNASSYRASGPLPPDGRWTLTPDVSAPYRTRVLVRRPARPAAFNGTVIVEWLNVSGGIDADAEWASLHEEIVRRGYAWVGVSAQLIGVMGGPVAVSVPGTGTDVVGKGLKGIDPARYSSLEHPGDGFSFDIYTQVARAIRSGGALGGLRPQRLIAAGESQSAFALVTYYDAVQPLTKEFDGFFVHSRGASAMPPAPGKYADVASGITGTPTIFRTDQDAPVLDVQTETDVGSVLNSYSVRQPDTDRFRLWEVAGTAHADAHLVGSLGQSLNCGVPINNGPMHVVAKSALRALNTWVQTGKAPVVAPRIDVAAGQHPQIVRNVDGLALGGIRTPPVDVPVAALSGMPGPNPSIICLLLGSTVPLPAARLAQLYPSPTVYLKRYKADADAAIRAGFVLPEDRAALLAFAEPGRIPG
jgi:hypothetical protein